MNKVILDDIMGLPAYEKAGDRLRQRVIDEAEGIAGHRNQAQVRLEAETRESCWRISKGDFVLWKSSKEIPNSLK